jgi:hypothetical protein
MVKIPLPAKALAASACAALCLLLGACAKTVSTGSFSGEEHEVAQAISNLQSDVVAADRSKICSRDLAAETVARLNAAPGGCKAVIKEQLAEIDSSDLSIQSIQLSGTGAQRSAQARVRSTYAGKKTIATVSLAKQGATWKISAVS